MASDDSGLPPERQRPAPTIDLKANEVSSRAHRRKSKPRRRRRERQAGAGARLQDSPPARTDDNANRASADARPLHLRPVLWAARPRAAIVLFGLGIWLGMSLMNRDDQLSQVAARLDEDRSRSRQCAGHRQRHQGDRYRHENDGGEYRCAQQASGRHCRKHSRRARAGGQCGHDRRSGAEGSRQRAATAGTRRHRSACPIALPRSSNPRAQASANSPPTTRSAGARWSRPPCATAVERGQSVRGRTRRREGIRNVMRRALAPLDGFRFDRRSFDRRARARIVGAGAADDQGDRRTRAHRAA